MSMRKDSAKTRAFRPATDALEGRQLLSGVVSGTDADGDTWVLRLIGPGAISVVKQNGADGKPSPLNSKSEISSITIGGTDPLKTRLVGTVHKAAGGDGKVFFQNLSGLPSRSESSPAVGQGLVSIDARNFWLGNTTPATATGATSAPRIVLPDGVETLRFGGVDTTHDRAAATSATQSDTADVVLGLPRYGGSRMIIDRSVSSAESVTDAPSSIDPNPVPRVIQHGVVFAAGGRLSAFQANEIDGNAALPPGQFGRENTAATGAGGTTVISTTAGGSFFPTGVAGLKGTGVGGQIGFLNVGGNATNFTTVVEDPTGGDTAKISNYYVGGETNNVMLIAPDGSRNVQFGKGMDTVEIRSHVINTLKANRGAVGSTVAVDRQISRADFGGDVVNTTVLAGYNQSYSTIIAAISRQNGNGVGTPAAPPLPLNAETSGGFFAHVAGDVKNSVFAASVQPVNNTFGGTGQLVLPTGHIKAKVEGSIDNAKATPDNPTTAFYASHVSLTKAPVAPPAVPEAPFTKPSVPYSLPGVNQSVLEVTPQSQPHAEAVTTANTAAHHAAVTRTHAAAVPAAKAVAHHAAAKPPATRGKKG